MFGLLKESIIDVLSENYYQDKKLFQKNAKGLISEIKKSKTFSEYQSTYRMIAEAKFTDFDTARLFVDETINHLRSLDKSDLLKISEKVNMNENYSSNIYKLIDALLVENIKITDKVKYKTELVKTLVGEPEQRKSQQKISIDPNYEATFKRILNKKLSERLSSLTEDEKKVLSVLIKEDKNSINQTYQDLIDENLSAVKNIDGSTKILVESKLNEMRNQEATTDALISLIELKKDLKNV